MRLHCNSAISIGQLCRLLAGRLDKHVSVSLEATIGILKIFTEKLKIKRAFLYSLVRYFRLLSICHDELCLCALLYTFCISFFKLFFVCLFVMYVRFVIQIKVLTNLYDLCEIKFM